MESEIQMSKTKAATSISKAARALSALGIATLSVQERRLLAKMVEDDGQPAVAKRFNVGTGTIARAMAGLGLRRSTASVIVAGLPGAAPQEGAGS